MALPDQRKANHHRGTGYAPAGYPKGSGFDRRADCGYCAAAAFLCGTNGTGFYPQPTGRGHRHSQSKGRTLRQKAPPHPTGISIRLPPMAKRHSLRQKSRQSLRGKPPNLSKMGKNPNQNPVVTKVDFRNHKNTKNNLANSGLFCYYIGIRWCVFVSLTPWLQKSTILTTQSKKHLAQPCKL